MSALLAVILVILGIFAITALVFTGLMNLTNAGADRVYALDRDFY